MVKANSAEDAFMDLAGVPFLSMLRDRMSWLSQRQTVLSENVANADTPGYTARDLKPLDFETLLRKVHGTAGRLTTDDPHHIATRNDEEYSDIDTPDNAGTTSGNTVSLEQEMIKVSETQADFQAASNLYAKALQMMRTAIG
jgi:flagellar basal-body rod protein FlgB